MDGVRLRLLLVLIAGSAQTVFRSITRRCWKKINAITRRSLLNKPKIAASKDSYLRKERNMIQFDFFKVPFGTHPKKLARRDGPDTSQKSAEKIDSTKLEGMVYEAIAKHGERGCISDEIRQQFAHLPYSSVTARYKALLDKGFIEDTGERRPGTSGRPQRVMRVIK